MAFRPGSSRCFCEFSRYLSVSRYVVTLSGAAHERLNP